MRRKTLKRLLLLLTVLGLIAAVKVSGLDRYLTFSYIKASHDRFERLYAEHRVPVIAGYMAVYILTTGMNMPSALVLSLAGGALFGFWVGTVVVSFASTIGATLSCFISRYVLRDWVQEKFGGMFPRINQGIEREGAFYLFSLRLIPGIPFAVVNILMGLTRIPLIRYYWISQVAMLPATMVFVNAGKELAEIESPSGILSPGFVLSLALIGLLPIAAKKLLNWYRLKREGTARKS